MKRSRVPAAFRVRLIAIAALALAAVVLAVLRLGPGDNPETAERPGATAGAKAGSVAGSATGSSTDEPSFEDELASVCAQFGIPEKAVRMRKVTDRTGRLVRREYRIAVPKEFSSIEFNLALNRRVEPAGARVLGSEQTRERAVTLHVVQDEKTVMSVILNQQN